MSATLNGLLAIAATVLSFVLGIIFYYKKNNGK